MGQRLTSTAEPEVRAVRPSGIQRKGRPYPVERVTGFEPALWVHGDWKRESPPASLAKGRRSRACHLEDERTIQIEIETPKPDRISAALAVARRWPPAFAAGERADESCYWHNVGEWEAEIKKTPSRTRLVEAGVDIHLSSLNVHVFDGGLEPTT